MPFRFNPFTDKLDLVETGGGGGGITTINGDTGSITGSTVTIFANQAALNSGSSVSFVNSGTVSTLNLTDVNLNTLIGNDSGNLTLSGGQNVGISGSLQDLTTGSWNTAVNTALNGVTTGQTNIGLGFGAGGTITTGSGNIVIGYLNKGSSTGNNNVVIQGGTNYNLAESNNICIGNVGVANETNIMRLGTSGSGAGQVNKAFVAGVTGVTAVGSPVAVSSTGQLSDLGFGSSTQVLTSNGAAVSPTWQAIPSQAITWTDEGTSFNALATNGYFVTAAATATLPASPSQGNTISFNLDAAATLTIKANTGQVIRLGATVSASAGTCASSTRGNSITLVYRSSDTAWIGLSSVGTWTIT